MLHFWMRDAKVNMVEWPMRYVSVKCKTGKWLGKAQFIDNSTQFAHHPAFISSASLWRHASIFFQRHFFNLNTSLHRHPPGTLETLPIAFCILLASFSDTFTSRFSHAFLGASCNVTMRFDGPRKRALSFQKKKSHHVGLDISATAIKLVELRSHGQHLYLENYYY